MTAGSSMLAMTLSFPPQRAQASMSIPNSLEEVLEAKSTCGYFAS